jgi:hypothetical protein
MVRSLSLAFALSAVVMTCGISYAGDNDNRISPSPVEQGFAISPANLNLPEALHAKLGRPSIPPGKLLLAPLAAGLLIGVLEASSGRAARLKSSAERAPTRAAL